jgi:2'-5' RNA ligase
LTLKFLGEVPEGEIEQIGAALRKACADHRPFEASLSSFGAFPSARRARVIWAGAGAGTEELRALAADVEAAFEPLGFGTENRTFVPHATLGRARGKPVRLELPAIVPREPGFGISRVELMESKLAAGGAVYQTVHSLALPSGC